MNREHMRPINLDKDYAWLQLICNTRDVKTFKKEYLPSTGYIVEGKCFCFVYETNSKVCILEHLVSAKGCDTAIVDKLIKDIMDLQMRKGYTLVVGITTHEKVINRIKKYGGKASEPHTAFYKKL